MTGTPDTVGPAPLRPEDPDVLGPFRLHGRLGAGGMGTVYAALDADRRPVAVKAAHARLGADPEFRARFAREVDLVGRVRSVCVPHLLSADTTGQRPWMATEYVPGPTLRRWVRTYGPLDGDRLNLFASGVAEALRAIHLQRIVHRDLKPGNVVLSPEGPKVLDFGIARALEESAITRAGLMGTPGWVAPEQYAGVEPSAASDVFAWGALVCYAATGRAPFGEGPAETAAFRVTEQPPDLDGLPGDLRPLVEAALAKDPARRPDAAALLCSLALPPGAGVGGGQEQTVEAATRILPTALARGWDLGRVGTSADWVAAPPRRQARRRRRRRLVVPVAALTALVMAAGLGWAAGQRTAPVGTAEETAGTEAAGQSATTQEAGGAESPEPEPEPVFADTDRGGLNLLDEGQSPEWEAAVLAGSVDNTFQLYGTEEGVPDDFVMDEVMDTGEVVAALTLEADEAEGGGIQLSGEAVYSWDSGDFTLHSRDFVVQSFEDGAFADMTPPQEHESDEDEVLVTLTAEQRTGEFTVTFPEAASPSVLVYTLETDLLNGVDKTGPGDILTADKCVDPGEPDGSSVSVMHQMDDCNPAWFESTEHP